MVRIERCKSLRDYLFDIGKAHKVTRVSKNIIIGFALVLAVG